MNTSGLGANDTITVQTHSTSPGIFSKLFDVIDVGASAAAAKCSSSDVQSALQGSIGTVLRFPVFHVLTGTDSNAQYEIIGWVGFHLDNCTVHSNNATLQSYFTTFNAKGIQSSMSSSEPDFGVRTIQLIH
jgi:hypothetical protein